MKFKSAGETVAWFKDRYIEGSLILKPPYQRKPVWRDRQRSYLVESVLKGFPIPEVFVQRETTSEGSTTYSVVDGQQRIRTLLAFAGSGDDELDTGFSLTQLNRDSPWYGQSFADLDESARKEYFGYEIGVRFLDVEGEDLVREMFTRLNRYTEQLKPQELRNASYVGAFARLANSLADTYGDFLAEHNIVTVQSIRRMGDIEFMADLLIGVMDGPQSGTPRGIDAYYDQFEDFEDEFPGMAKAKRSFNSTMALLQEAANDLNERWLQKSDFYTLFVAAAHDAGAKSALRDPRGISQLSEFADQVDYRITHEDSEVVPLAADYARNVMRAPNEKARRVARHQALTTFLSEPPR